MKTTNNQKIIVISDVHGRQHWKQILKQEPTYDKVVFLGDYFDSFYILGPDQISNFVEILEFKRKFPNKVELLVGNHDISYITGIPCSGFQHELAMEIHNHLIKPWMEGEINTCYISGNIIFSHAGFTETFFTTNKTRINCSDLDLVTINEMTKAKPVLLEHAGYDNYGDSIYDGPVWVRPNSLLKDKLPKYIQVVGHTSMEVSYVNDVWFTDSQEQMQYLFIDKQYFKTKTINRY